MNELLDEARQTTQTKLLREILEAVKALKPADGLTIDDPDFYVKLGRIAESRRESETAHKQGFKLARDIYEPENQRLRNKIAAMELERAQASAENGERWKGETRRTQQQATELREAQTEIERLRKKVADDALTIAALRDEQSAAGEEESGSLHSR